MIEIPKANEDRSNYPCWKGVSTMDGRSLKPLLYCKCGQVFGLGNHSIDIEGNISPSVWHRDNNGCGFHEYLKLDGYTGKSH